MKILSCDFSVVCSHPGHHYAFVKRLNCEQAFHITYLNVKIDSIFKFNSEGVIDIIPIKDLECVCTTVSPGTSTMYLYVPLNYQELE